MMIRLTAVFALAAALLAVAPERAHACSCMMIEQPQAFEQATSVFEGHVASVDGPSDPHGAGEVRVTLDVVRTWKGADSEQIEVVTPANSAACGFNFEQGKSYLVYTSAGEAGGPEHVSLCSRTAPIERAGEDIAAMGEGVTPVSPTEPEPADPGGSTTDPGAPGTGDGQGTTTQYEAGCASCAVGAERGAPAPALLGGALVLLAALWRRRR